MSDEESSSMRQLHSGDWVLDLSAEDAYLAGSRLGTLIGIRLLKAHVEEEIARLGPLGNDGYDVGYQAALVAELAYLEALL